MLRVLARAGSARSRVEDPAPRRLDAAIATRAGSTPCRCPVDERGLDVDALAATRRARVIVTPAHQCADRRRAGAGAPPGARRAGRTSGTAIIIEDDYDAEFRYDRQPVGALQGLAPDRVVADRIGQQVAGAGAAAGLDRLPAAAHRRRSPHEKELADRGSPGLDQLALAALIESGRYDRHLRRMRARLRRAAPGARRRAGRRTRPAVELGGLAAGFHAVLHLPAGADEDAVVERARRAFGRPLRDERVPHSTAPTTPPQLVLGFGNVSEAAIERGIEAIAPLLRCGGRDGVGVQGGTRRDLPCPRWNWAC